MDLTIQSHLNHDIYSKREVEELLTKLNDSLLPVANFAKEEEDKNEKPVLFSESFVKVLLEKIAHQVDNTINSKIKDSEEATTYFEDEIELDFDHKNRTIEIEINNENIITQVVDNLSLPTYAEWFNDMMTAYEQLRKERESEL